MNEDEIIPSSEKQAVVTKVNLASRLLKRHWALGRHEHIFAFAVLLAVLAFFYRDVIFGGKTFLTENFVPATLPTGPYEYSGVDAKLAAIDGGANGWYNEPLNRFISRSLHQGDFPLWNPYSGLAGAPLFSDGIEGPLEPIQFLFFLMPEKYWAYGIDAQLLIRFLLAGFFCYLFARRQKIGMVGGIAAGSLFMLSNYFIQYGNHPQAKTELLLPLVMYGFDRLTDINDRVAEWLCILFVGWAIIAAMPESTFFILLLASLWYVFKGMRLLFQHNWQRQVFKRLFFRFFLAALGGFLISSVYLFPFIENYLNSNSFHAAGTSLNIIYPFWSLFGTILLIYRGGFVQNYLGFIPIFCALLALVNFRQKAFRFETYFFSGYTFLFIMVSYGFPLLRWVAKLPLFSQVIIAKYSMPSMMFSVAILAGIAIQKLKQWGISPKSVLWAIGLEFGGFLLIPYMINPTKFLSFFNNYQNIYLIFIFLIVVCVLVFSIMGFLYRAGKISNLSCQAFLIFLILLDCLFWSAGRIRSSREDPYAEAPFVKYLQRQPETFRVYSDENYLYPNISSVYGIADIRWLYAMVNSRTYAFSAKFIAPDEAGIRFTGNETPISDRMFNLLNVRYLIYKPTDETGQNVVYRGEDAAVVEVEGALPRAFVTFHVVPAKDLDDALQLVDQTQGVDTGRAAVVENLPAMALEEINRNATGLQIVSALYGPINSGEVKIEVSTPSAGLLVLSDQYDPGWKAELDGKPTSIYAVDGILRGVLLPIGNHTVIFKYEPSLLKIGMVISILILAITVYALGKEKLKILRKGSR